MAESKSAVITVSPYPYGQGGEDRTHDLHIPNVALSLAELHLVN